MVRLHKSSQRLELVAPAYTLAFDRERPWVVTVSTGTGTRIADLFVGSGVDTPRGRDELGPIEAPTLGRDGDATVVTFTGRSSRWDAKRYVFTCHDGELEYRVEVSGEGRVDKVAWWQGCVGDDLARMGITGGLFRGYERPYADIARGSRAGFQGLHSARPTAAERDVRLYWEDDTVDLVDDPQRFGGCDSFLPALWGFVLELGPEDPWVGLGLAPRLDELDFGAFRFRGGSLFGLELEYDARVKVQGEWRSPSLVMTFGSRDSYTAFRSIVAMLEGRGLVRQPEGPAPAWWSRPVFDTTGQQHWLADGGDPAAVSSMAMVLDTLAVLERAEADPGVIWIGPGWWDPAHPGQPDPLRWPDLTGFVAQQHAAGRRVVLSWPLLPGGETPPGPWEELVRELLATDGADADGLRVVEVTPRNGSVAVLFDHLARLRRAARAARSDALIVAPTCNPYFAELVDMVPLGGLWTDRRSVEPMLRHRARLARMVSPSWLLAAGDWHAPSVEAWHEAMRLQDELGVPVVSYAGGLEQCGEPLGADDLRVVARAWRSRA